MGSFHSAAPMTIVSHLAHGDIISTAFHTLFNDRKNTFSCKKHGNIWFWDMTAKKYTYLTFTVSSNSLFGSRFSKMDNRLECSKELIATGWAWQKLDIMTRMVQPLRVVWRGDPVVGQGVGHILGAHLVKGRIPDGVLLWEQVCQELCREKSNETEDEVKQKVDVSRLNCCVSVGRPFYTTAIYTISQFSNIPKRIFCRFSAFTVL